ncbi:hypothetical protein LXA43DRAFT_1135086 [Ganoderma leucocontextum]|nr:hypothetical protein LXA43DRAFT_1135086 [Ganoderma leucocontextum]
MSFHYDDMTSITAPTSNMHAPASESAVQITDNVARLRQWCERLGNYYGLKPEQYDDMKQLANLMGAADVGLAKVLIWQQMTLYRIWNKVETQGVDYNRFTQLLADVEELVGTAWTLSDDQATTVRVVARDLLVAHSQSSYTMLHLEVMSHLRTRKESLGFGNVFGHPAHEKTLLTNIRKKTSNARTSLRELIICSIAGKTKRPLEDMVWDALNKFKKGGAGTDINNAYLFRFALLRRWTYEDLFADMVVDATDNLGTMIIQDLEEQAEQVSAPSSKKRKLEDGDKALKPTVGKVPKGEDFWSKMEQHLATCVTLWGDDTNTAEWREYLNETIQRDRRLFGMSTSGVISPIPVINTPPPAPLQAPIPTTPGSVPFDINFATPPATGPYIFAMVVASQPASSVQYNSASSSLWE